MPFALLQALELNDDSKPEQLIAFLDDICSLRYSVPFAGLLRLYLSTYVRWLQEAEFAERQRASYNPVAVQRSSSNDS